MTYQELAAEIIRLPLAERLALLELVTRSLREELARQPRAGSLAMRLRGIGEPDSAPPTDEEARADYTDYLAEKL
jgi:hypothetical protein